LCRSCLLLQMDKRDCFIGKNYENKIHTLNKSKKQYKILQKMEHLNIVLIYVENFVEKSCITMWKKLWKTGKYTDTFKSFYENAENK